MLSESARHVDDLKGKEKGQDAKLGAVMRKEAARGIRKISNTIKNIIIRIQTYQLG